MMKIIRADRGIEFAYSPEFNKAFFEVWVVSFGSAKRKSLKIPLGITESALNAKLDAATASGAAKAALLSPIHAPQHCRLYERNSYYLSTLLHDASMHSFISWLQEWYIRNFTASLVALALESPAFADGSLQAALQQASDSAVAGTVGEMLVQIDAAVNKPLHGPAGHVAPA
ncbi:MAG: hypothetical protein RLZZ618_282 [Pseudomonadota bacterium]